METLHVFLSKTSLITLWMLNCKIKLAKLGLMKLLFQSSNISNSVYDCWKYHVHWPSASDGSCVVAVVVLRKKTTFSANSYDYCFLAIFFLMGSFWLLKFFLHHFFYQLMILWTFTHNRNVWFRKGNFLPSPRFSTDHCQEFRTLIDLFFSMHGPQKNHRNGI